MAAVGAVVTLAMVLGASVSARADSAPSSPQLGGFALGDRLEALIDERTGAFQFSAPVAGLMLAWDSRFAASDRDGLGDGWGFGLATVATAGGVRVYPASGGVYEADASSATGLQGYPTTEVEFTQTAGVLDPRPAGTGGTAETAVSRAYAYSLGELGGATTYFDEHGAAIARVDAFGDRTDWVRDPERAHRLTKVVDPDGVVTELDWTSASDRVSIRRGTNLDEAAGARERAQTWVVEFDGIGLAVTDPTGGRLDVVGRDGLVSRIEGVAGATTEVTWHAHDDGVPRVAEVRTLDDGNEVSVRRWSAEGASATGWPAVQEPTPATGVGVGSGYTTMLSDGSTRLVSDYTPLQQLARRSLEIASAGGSSVAQEQVFDYPDLGGGDQNGGPGDWSRPTATEVTYHDAGGGARTVREEYVYDTLGRMTQRTLADGTVAQTTYDDAESSTGGPPVGLVLDETTTAPDGMVTRTVRQLNDERTAPIAIEEYAGPTDSELTRTSRVEYDVRDDGFVTEERAYPRVSGAPAITRWTESLDPAAGTLTLTETVAADTPAEATTSRVTSLLHAVALDEVDALGNTATTTYDAIGRPTSRVDAAGRETTMSHETARHDGRNATTVTSPSGVATTEIRDALGRTVEVTDNVLDGEVVAGHDRVIERRSYELAGTTERTDAWGAVSTTVEDVFGRVTSVTGPSGLTQLTAHDDVANTTTTLATPTGSAADAETSTVETRDAAGRVIATEGTRRDGIAVPSTSTQFDGLDRVRSASDGTQVSTHEFDAFGNAIASVVAPVDAAADPLTASRRFDGFGTPVEKTLSEDGATRSGGERIVDVLGRTVEERDQLGRSTFIAYTPDGLVERVTAPSGQVSEFEYDEETRQPIRSTVTSPIGATVATEYDYDDDRGELLAVFDPADRAATEIRYTHDAHGNLTELVYPDGRSIEHGYDQHGRRVSLTDVEGNITRYSYDEAGLLTSAVQHAAGDVLLAEVAYEYDELGRMTSKIEGNGVTTAYTFTSASQIATETTTKGSEQLSHRRYAYDERGNLSERTDDTTLAGERRLTTTAYEYDMLDRLVSSTTHDGDSTAAAATSATSYALSPFGDIETESVTTAPGTEAAATTTRAFSYSPLGELTGIETTAPDGTVTVATQDYDVAGNLVRDHRGHVFAYDAANRPVSEVAPNGAADSTTYWPDGRRQEVLASTPGTAGASTRFYWDDGTLVNDVHTAAPEASAAQAPQPATVAAYLLAAARHARSLQQEATAPVTTYDVTDRHGSVTERTDAAGAVVERYVYSDYGRVLEHVSAGPDAPATGADRNPYGYAGEYTDRFGGQWLHARTYDSGTMRLTIQDTADLHNLYNFADLNPITLADPTGRTPESDAALNGALGGLSIVFGVVTGVAAIATGGASLGFFGVVGLVADFVGVGIATTLLVDDLSSWSLPPNVKEGLTYGEYGLAGLGLLGAVETGVKLAVNAYRSERAAKAVATRLAIKKSLVAANVEGEPAITRLDDLHGDAFAHVLGKTISTARQTHIEFLYDSNRKSLYTGAYQSNGSRVGAADEPALTSNHEALSRYTQNPGPEVRLDGPTDVYLQARGHLTGGTISMPYRSKSGAWKVLFTDDSGHFGGSAPQVFWSDERHAAIAKYFSDRGIRARFHAYDSGYIRKFKTAMMRGVVDVKNLKFG